MTDGTEDLVRWENAIIDRALDSDLCCCELLELMLRANVDDIVDEDKVSVDRLETIDHAKLRLWRLAVAYRSRTENT